MTVDTSFLPTLTQFDIERAAQVSLRIFCSNHKPYGYLVVDPRSLRAAIDIDITG
jgi:hypothetical protein